MMLRSRLISRRAALALPAIAFAGFAVADSADVDVAIVGAGAAGLAAAKAAEAAGLTFVVVEARQRIGGRTVTDMSLGAPFDGGAQFIHFSDRNPWTGIAEKLGVETRPGSWRMGGSREFKDGQPAGTDGNQWRSGRNQMWAMAENVDYENDVSFADLVKTAPADVQAAARSMSRGAVGEEPERVSVADYSRLYEGNDRIIPAGYGALVAKYGEGVPVRLGVKVTKIDWRGQGVVLTTTAGDIKARKAVITVPLGVLKAGHIAFTPALPKETTGAIDGLAMGALSKVGLRFEGDRFGAGDGMHYVELPGNKPGMSFEMFPFGRDIVVCWYGGDYAREVNRLGDQGAVGHMLERLLTLVGADGRKAFRGGVAFGWSEDPFSLGGYSYAKPGHARARDVLRRSVGDRLWFAGEACAGKASMTVGGAQQTGEQAVQAIAAKLKGR